MKKLIAIALGVALAGVGTVALASRNSSGTHTLPAGNPVVSGTSISTTWANNTLGDISQSLTDSLDRNGKGGMLAPLRTPNGSVTAPTHSFTNDTDTGLYLSSAGDTRIAVAGVDSLQCTATGVTVPGTLGVTGAITATTGTFSGTLTVATPSNATDAASKGYVDAYRGPAVGQQVSASSGLFSTSSASLVDVTNLSSTITVSGRPVVVSLQSDGSGNPTSAQIPAGATVAVRLLRGATAIGDWYTSNQGSAPAQFAPAVQLIDVVGAGTYTYKVQMSTTAGPAYLNRWVLVAYEL